MSPGWRRPARAVALALGWLVLSSPVVHAQPDTGVSTAGLAWEASGRGVPVVLIHAFSLDRRMWRDQIAALESRHRVIRYDLRGHGASAAPDAPYSAVADLASVLEAAGVQRAALVGLSAGAEIALDFALAFPDRVTRVVLAAPGLSGFQPSTPLDWLRPVFEAAAAGDSRLAAARWAATPIMALHRDTSAAALVRAVVADNARLWSYRRDPAIQLQPPAVDRLAEVSRPVLVVVGSEDLPHIREVATRIATQVPGARQATVPGAGHLVNLDAPVEFGRLLERFLEAGDGGRPDQGRRPPSDRRRAWTR